MSECDVVHIREYQLIDHEALRQIFRASIHQLTVHQYSEAQRIAWASASDDAEAWRERLEEVRPYVAEVAGRIAGFADVQGDGYIDFFFVAPEFAGRGVAKALMRRLHEIALARGLEELYSNVSLTAEPFFAKHGFSVEARQTVTVRGVALNNARMRKRLKPG